MTIRLNTLTHPSQWLQLDEAAEAALAEFEPWSVDEDAALDRYTADHDLDVIGIDVTDISVDDALTIADRYADGEFDDEVAGIVAAMRTLREHVRTLASRVVVARRWEAEAKAVLKQWDEVGDVVHRLEPCPLGQISAVHARRVVEQLIADREMRTGHSS